MTFKNVDEVVNKYAKYVVQQSKSNLTKDKKGGGDLYNSCLLYTSPSPRD